MPSYDPEFQDEAKPTPESFDPTPRRNGCWFYGCVLAIVSLVVVLLGLAVVAFVIYRTLTQYVETYTAVAPVVLPKVEITERQQKSAVERARKFRDALRAKAEAEPLVLTGDDLNALVLESPKLKDRVYMTIAGDKVKARVSLPLDEFFNTRLTRGRFLNGEAELKASIQDGKARLEVESIEVGGKELPESVRELFEQTILDLFSQNTLDLEKQGDRADMLHRIASFEIKDDKVVITSRSAQDAPKPKPAEPPGPPAPAGVPKPEPAAAP